MQRTHTDTHTKSEMRAENAMSDARRQIDGNYV